MLDFFEKWFMRLYECCNPNVVQKRLNKVRRAKVLFLSVFYLSYLWPGLKLLRFHQFPVCQHNEDVKYKNNWMGGHSEIKSRYILKIKKGWLNLMIYLV